MKKIFFLITALLPFAVMAQTEETFLIRGKVGNLSTPAKAYLLYQYGANKVLDSAVMTAGSFDFSGKILGPVSGAIVIDHKGVGFEKQDSSADVLSLFIDKGEFSITGTDSVKKARITGSKINEDSETLRALLAPVNEKAKRILAVKNAATPTQSTPEFMSTLHGRYKALQAEQKSIIKKFVIDNPDSYISLMALYSVQGPSPEDPVALDSLFNTLSPRLKATEDARNFKAALVPLMRTAPGTMAPEFTQNDVNGVPVKLSSFRGKYVLVDFWASWCGPCRQENPNVVRVYNKYKDKNFTVLGVSLDRETGRNDWLAAIKNDGLSWTQVSDLKFWSNDAAKLYYVSSIPANFLIDPSGKIIAKNLRGDDLEEKLKEVLPK